MNIKAEDAFSELCNQFNKITFEAEKLIYEISDGDQNEIDRILEAAWCPKDDKDD